MTDDTAQRGYPRPHQDHNAADDAMRLRDALDMIDADVASGLALATETAAGRVMLATIAEAIAGGAIGKATTPAGVQAAIEAAIDGLIGAAPDALNTLNELAAALGNDPNLAATLTAAIAAKQPAHGNLTTLSGLADVANLAAMAGLAGTADKAVYFTAAGALALMTVTAKARTLLASADEAAMRAFLGLGSAALLTVASVDQIKSGAGSDLIANNRAWAAAAFYDLGNISGAVIIDCNAGANFRGTLTGNATVSFANAKDGQPAMLALKQDATGGRTVSWSAAVKFPDGIAPTVKTAANGYAIIFSGLYSLAYDHWLGSGWNNG